MGLVTGLLAAGLLGAGFLASRGGGEPNRNLANGRVDPTAEEIAKGIRPRPPGAETIGKAIPRDQANRNRANDAVASTNPPDASADESGNVSGARGVASRTRRRAAAGHAGRVTTGPSSTPGAQAGGTPRTLIGY